MLENEVVNTVADKRCYAGADSNVSKKKLAMSSNRDTLDREPAAPGEQECFILVLWRVLDIMLTETLIVA